MNNLQKRFPRYSWLLKLYPTGYRQAYGEQMLQTLADMLDDSERSHASVWAHLALDFPLSVVKQQLTFTGETMAHEMPDYVKRNALVSAVLLLPFLLALLANGFDKVINGRNLYHSWLWHMPVLSIWVLWLPLLAAVIAVTSLITLLLQRRAAEHNSWFKQLLAVRYTWPLLSVALVGIGIIGMVFFHDSVHCVTGNPIRELHNPHQTWQCIEQR